MASARNARCGCSINPSHFHRDSDDGLDVDRGDHLHGGDGAAVGGAGACALSATRRPACRENPGAETGRVLPRPAQAAFFEEQLGRGSINGPEANKPIGATDGRSSVLRFLIRRRSRRDSSDILPRAEGFLLIPPLSSAGDPRCPHWFCADFSSAGNPRLKNYGPPTPKPDWRCVPASR